MRILFLLTQDLESPSGLGRYWPLARSLVKKDHDVRIAALHSNWDSLAIKRFTRDGVVVEYVAPMHVMKSGNHKRYYSSFKLLSVALRATFSLLKSALKNDVDIIHICKPHPMNSIAGLLAASIKKSKLCVDCDDYEAGSNRFTDRWQKSAVAFFEKNIPHFAHLITTNTFFMKSKLLSWGYAEKKIIFLSNGVEINRFTPPEAEEIAQLRAYLRLEGNKTILFVGSLSLASHPVDLLIKGFSILAEKQPNIVLLIIGGGEDYQYLVNLAESLNISHLTRFTGRIEPAKVPAYYALADVSVDPVYDDDAARGRSPLKLFESWICGVPFITSPVGDRQLIIGNPPAGLLVQPAGDPNALADGILMILNSPDLAHEFRTRGFERVQQFTWQTLSERLEQEYKKLL